MEVLFLMKSKRINKNFAYSPELKLTAVEQYLAGESVTSICLELGIQDPHRIYVWKKAYLEKGNDAFIDKRGRHSTGRPRTNFMSMQEENDYLRAQNMLLKKSIERKKG